MAPEQPTQEQARAFAVMLQAGLPGEDAIRYFVDDEDPGLVAQTLHRWKSSRLIRGAMLSLMGKAWQDMSVEEMIDVSLRNHYAQLAYMLFNNHYATVNASDKQKLDTARVTLEAKKAGTAGARDPLSMFFEDIRTGKVKLNKSAPVAPLVGTH